MIHPGGLLLVVPRLFALPPLSFMGEVAKKSKLSLNLEVRNIFAWSHSEHWSGYSK